jgi:hypothetical protein
MKTLLLLASVALIVHLIDRYLLIPLVVQCDGGMESEHPFFMEWEKAEQERIRAQRVNKWIEDLTSDRSADA